MDKGTTQGKRFSGQNRVAGDYSYDSTGDSELFCQYKESIVEVGGAYLSEKPRSGVGKMPKFLDPSDDDYNCDDSAYCDSGTCYSGYISNVQHQLRTGGNGQCDSGAYHTDDSYQKPKVDEDGRYEPNSSWRRRSHPQQRQPCDNSITTVQSHTESIRPVRKLTDD
jgi:hypothetical protein